MNHSLHKVSLLKLAAIYALAIILSGVALYLMLPVLSENLLAFLTETGIMLFVTFFTVRHLNKAGISLRSIIGDLTVNKKSVLFFSGLSAGRLILYFSFAGLVMRFLIDQPDFLSDAESLLNDTDPAGFSAWSIISIVVLAPVIEEFIFRGIILNKWAEKRSNTHALILSSLLFGLLHVNTFIIPQMIGGLLYGMVYLKTKKLIYPILMHALFNLLPLLIQFIPVEEPTGSISVSEQLIAELTPVLNVASLVFIVTLPVFVFVVYRYSRNLNDEVTPFVFNSELATDSAAEK